ncbi:hypothetical protein FGIG_11004 [Fasciola gigantica]|uniref:Uncharacterized protein n=1 Tax=Fasciola gigantica TaxID=46835 RepID=A0A504YI45_FASGI|nr:hypothetical protein FGIG_11004 [Fasciola gigantica]
MQGDRGRIWEKWSGLAVSSSENLTNLDFPVPPKGAIKQNVITEEAQITESPFVAGTVFRMRSVFIPPINSLYQFRFPFAKNAALLGGLITKTLDKLALTSGLWTPITMNQDQP